MKKLLTKNKILMFFTAISLVIVTLVIFSFNWNADAEENSQLIIEEIVDTDGNIETKVSNIENYFKANYFRSATSKIDCLLSALKYSQDEIAEMSLSKKES